MPAPELVWIKQGEQVTRVSAAFAEKHELEVVHSKTQPTPRSRPFGYGLENPGALVKYRTGGIVDGRNGIRLTPVAADHRPPAAGNKGLVIFNDTAGKYQGSNGTTWVDLS